MPGLQPQTCRLGAALVACLIAVSAPTTQAGDEVDYSAPYIVVENGELVTRYPAVQHDGVAAAAAPEMRAAPSKTESAAPVLRIILTAMAATVLAAIVLIAWRRAAARARQTVN